MPDYCTACRNVFPDEDTRVAHEEAAHPYLCQRCERRFDTESLYKEHMKARHPFACRWCDEQGCDVHDLALHIYHNHSFACEVCENAAFKNKEQCMEHERRMHPPCKECNKVFLNADVLSRHTELVHPRCHWCSVPFKTLNALQQHMKAAHVMCNTCSKMCESRVTLQAHVEKRHPSCETCHVAFSTREDVVAHREQAHPACSSCGTQFGSARSLATHVKEKHVDFLPTASIHHIPNTSSPPDNVVSGRRASVAPDVVVSASSESKIEESIRAASAYHLTIPPAENNTSSSTHSSHRQLMPHLETLEHSGDAMDDKIASSRPLTAVHSPHQAIHADGPPTPRAQAPYATTRRASAGRSTDALDDKILESIRAASAYNLAYPGSGHHLGSSSHGSAFHMSTHTMSSSMHAVDERIQESISAAASAMRLKSSPPQNRHGSLSTTGLTIMTGEDDDTCVATGIRGAAREPSPVETTKRLHARRRPSVQSQSSEEPPTPRVWPVSAQPLDTDIEYVSAASSRATTQSGFTHVFNPHKSHHHMEHSESASHWTHASEKQPRTERRPSVSQSRVLTVVTSTYEMPRLPAKDGNCSSSSSRHSSVSPGGIKSSRREGPPRAPDLHARFATAPAPLHPPLHTHINEHVLGPGHDQIPCNARPTHVNIGHVCPFCVTWLRGAEARETHMLECHALCRVCDFEYSTLSELGVHTREAHPTCRECHHQCGSVDELVRHTEVCHGT
jgi:hypothetical protein